jgi:hypothetical protein
MVILIAEERPEHKTIQITPLARGEEAGESIRAWRACRRELVGGPGRRQARAILLALGFQGTTATAPKVVWILVHAKLEERLKHDL